MEDNIKEQMPDEKEILEILATFEDELKQKNQDNKSEIQSVKYYETIELKKGKIHGVFITEEQDINGNISRHVYFQSPSNEILSIDHEGNIKINPEWRDYIDEIDFERTMEKNDEKKVRLKGISEKTSSKEVEKKLPKRKDKEEEKQEENPEEQIQQDIGGEEDLGISYYRPINDNSFDEQIGINLRGYKEIGLAYSKTKNAFILVGKKDGQFQQVEGFEPAQPTLKTVMSIDEKGEQIKKEVPHAIMETNNSKKELSITIGQYGYIEVGTIDRLPCDERVKRQVGEQGEGDEGRTSSELNAAIKQEGVEGVHNYIEQHKRSNENMQTGSVRHEDVADEIRNAQTEINGDDYIPNTNVKWKVFASACGYRDEDAIKHAQEVLDEAKTKPENQDKSNQEIVEQVIQDKEDEYRSQIQRNK